MANQFVHGNQVGPSPSMFRVIIEYYYSDTGTGWHVTFKYWVQVTAGDFWGTVLSTSWGATPSIGTPGPYGESGWGTKDIAYGASWSTSCSAQYSSHKSTATLNITVPLPTYTVAYDENGGTGGPHDQTKTYGVDLTLSGTKPTRTGYTFQSWNTKSDGTGTTYASGGTYKANSGATLYAIWKLNTYTVTFNASANGGTGSTTKTVTHGGKLSSFPTASKPYHKFLGWFTAQTGGTKITTSTVFTSGMTVYAQFELEATMAIYVGGEWNPAMPYIGENMGITYISIGEEWKNGIGGA